MSPMHTPCYSPNASLKARHLSGFLLSIYQGNQYVVYLTGCLFIRLSFSIYCLFYFCRSSVSVLPLSNSNLLWNAHSYVSIGPTAPPWPAVPLYHCPTVICSLSHSGNTRKHDWNWIKWLFKLFAIQQGAVCQKCLSAENVNCMTKHKL